MLYYMLEHIVIVWQGENIYMELLQLRYFLKACETQNFTYTAQFYSVPPSDISQSIRKLEKELGVVLFDREANRIILNQNGQFLFPRIYKALSEIDGACHELVYMQGDNSNDLNVLALCHRGLVSSCFEKISSEYPDAKLSLETGTDKQNKASFDLIISSNYDVIPEQFRKVFLMEEDFLVAVSASSPLAREDSISLDMLKDKKFISLANSAGFSTAFTMLSRYMKKMIRISINCEDIYYLCKYVENGMAVSLFPSVSWKHRISKGIRLIPIKDYRITRRTHLCINTQKNQNKKVYASFERAIKEAVMELVS